MAEQVGGEQYREIDGQLHEIKRQLRQKKGYPYELAKLKYHLQLAAEGKFIAKQPNKFLRIISSGLPIMLGEDAKGKTKVSTEILVDVFFTILTANFAEMFGTSFAELRRQCFTPDQIELCIKEFQQYRYHEMLDGYTLFFLVEQENKFYVRGVYLNAADEDEPAIVDNFKFNVMRDWEANEKYGIVVPHQA